MKLAKIVEAFSDKEIYFVASQPGVTLWRAIGQGSGTTLEIRNTSTYITNKQGDSNYEFDTQAIYDMLVKNGKAIAKKKTVVAYELPIYPRVHSVSGDKYDVWGGNIAPIGKMYLVASKSESNLIVIGFFKSRNEAVNWIRTTAE